MEIDNIPFKDNNIMYIVCDVNHLYNSVKSMVMKNIIKFNKTKQYMKFDKIYTLEFLDDLIDITDLEYHMSYLLPKSENEYTINNLYYYKLIQEMLNLLYYRFLNILVDDNYLIMTFNKNQFIWKEKE